MNDSCITGLKLAHIHAGASQVDPLVSFYLLPHAELCLMLIRSPHFENKFLKMSLTINYFEELQLHHRQIRLV